MGDQRSRPRRALILLLRMSHASSERFRPNNSIRVFSEADPRCETPDCSFKRTGTGKSAGLQKIRKPHDSGFLTAAVFHS